MLKKMPTLMIMGWVYSKFGTLGMGLNAKIHFTVKYLQLSSLNRVLSDQLNYVSKRTGSEVTFSGLSAASFRLLMRYVRSEVTVTLPTSFLKAGKSEE